jgi:hypothetical protein
MKKTIISIILAMIALSCLPQVNGVDLKKAIPYTTEKDIAYGKLMQYDNMGGVFYAILYKQDVIGLRDCVEEAVRLTALNNLDFNEPDFDYSIIDEGTDGVTDYGSLYLSLAVGSSRVNKIWNLQPDYRIALSLRDGFYYIMIGQTRQPHG